LHRRPWVFTGLFPHEAIGEVALFFLRVELMEPLVRIDGNHDIPRASVGLFALMTEFEIVENGGLRSYGKELK